MRATRARSVDQLANVSQTSLVLAPSGISTGFSANRAESISAPGTTRAFAQGRSASAARTNNSTSVTVALIGTVAHKVTGFASDSVHVEAGGGVADCADAT